jgi:hypothetical protein
MKCGYKVIQRVSKDHNPGERRVAVVRRNQRHCALDACQDLPHSFQSGRRRLLGSSGFQQVEECTTMKPGCFPTWDLDSFHPAFAVGFHLGEREVFLHSSNNAMCELAGWVIVL